jgi:N-acetyltransferase
MEKVVLQGKHVRLEPLGREHVERLVTAAAVKPELYRWSLVPQGVGEMTRYVETALAWQRAGTATALATVRLADGEVVGSTRFFDVERWAWPEGHPRHGGEYPDGCEIGYTWLTASAVRTAINGEAKLLMLTHAFEHWKMLRVCFHTDVRNERSRAALARIGASFEGILRSHRMAADFTPRNSARFSIVAGEWAQVKEKLEERTAASVPKS